MTRSFPEQEVAVLEQNESVLLPFSTVCPPKSCDKSVIETSRQGMMTQLPVSLVHGLICNQDIQAQFSTLVFSLYGWLKQSLTT